MDLSRAIARRAVEAGRAIRAAVHAMPLGERARPAASRLKAANVGVDARAEEIGLDHLVRLAAEIGRPIRLLVDDRGGTETLGPAAHAEAVWACFDAIDGTKKLAGIEPWDEHRLAAASDGAWAATFAFSAPTAKRFDELTLGDFVTAAIVDGNPATHTVYPSDVVTIADIGAEPVAYDASRWPAGALRRVFTTSCERLNRCWVFLDAFQAFDRDSRSPGDEELAVELYRRLIDRHAETGAYDVLRQFGSLSALCRVLLGWREEPVWLESQGGGFVVVNENLPNLIPSLPVVAGAGGVSLDFGGDPLRDRPLAAGRTSVVHAANQTLARVLLGVVAASQASASTRAPGAC